MLARDYKIRVFAVFAFFCCLLSIVAVRLFLLQVRHRNFFKLLAQQQYELEVAVKPPRGVIYDSNGAHPLAFNRHKVSAFLVPRDLEYVPKTRQLLKRHFPEVYKRYARNKNKHFMWLARHITDQQHKLLASFNCPDIHFIDEFARYYPYQAAAQLVGLTDIDNAGIAGLELYFGKQLGGRERVLSMQKDARSGAFYFEKSVQNPGRRGSALTLTVDTNLQEMVLVELQQQIAELGAKSGTVMVANPDNGEVLAMASYPVFDANHKGQAATEAMKNIAVNECFEFGSVMKAFCALAALEEGVVSLNEPIDCEGRFAYVDGVRVENPTISLLNHLAEHDNIIPFHEVVRYSSNVGIAKVAKRLGPDLYTHLRRLGFGSKTGLQFPGERSGLVNPPERWSKPSLIVMSFGYELMATVAQLTKAFCIIANGGYDVQPTLVRGEGVGKGKRLYKETTIAGMKEIMEKVTEKFHIPGVRMMGKTGTAQCIKNGRYSRQDHQYSFGGIIEKGDYRRVIVTFVREPKKASLWASEVAEPLFASIAQRMLVCDTLAGKLTI